MKMKHDPKMKHNLLKCRHLLSLFISSLNQGHCQDFSYVKTRKRVNPKIKMNDAKKNPDHHF